MTSPKQAIKDKRKIAHQDNRINALTERLDYYKDITETVNEPFIILDKNLCVITANLVFYRKFKVREKETESKRIYELGDNQWDVPKLRDLLEHILPAHRVFNNYEITHDFPGIGVKTMRLNARQIDSKQLILLAIEDITSQSELKVDADKLTAKLIDQRDQLQGLNNSKDEFISLASHQLRTPATAVKQYVAMLRAGYAGKISKPQARMLDIAYRNNERQLEIIEDLLRVASIDAGKVFLNKSLCDIVQQVEMVIQQQAVSFTKRGQTVVLNMPSKTIFAFIDQKLMLMVLENLLDNAGKYSPDGQVVFIDIKQDTEHTIVSIKDTGVGIRKNDQQKLFKKFSRIDNSLSVPARGTGLGLYWAKKILDLHEGSIEVISKLNKGSTFIVKMPTVSHFSEPVFV